MKDEPGFERQEYPPTNSPLKAIRRFCLSCVCGSSKDIAECQDGLCPLFAFRFGCSPTTAKRRGKNVGR